MLFSVYIFVHFFKMYNYDIQPKPHTDNNTTVIKICIEIKVKT